MENNTLSELQRTAMSFDTAVLKPVFVGEEKFEDKNHFAIWNNDKERVSAVVSPEYELIQHRMVVDGVAEALRDLGLDKEAQVSHIANSGDAVFIDINFPSAKLYCGLNEHFIGGIRIINSYNKTTSICVLPHVLRLACMNGLVVNVGVMKEFSVHHTNKLAKEFADIIPQILKSMIDNNEKFKMMVNGCITDSVEWESMKIIVGALMKTDKHRDKIWEILLKENKEKYSRYDLLNAITSYCTHNGKLTPLVQNMLQTKAKTVLVTPLSGLMPKQEITA